MQQIKPPIKIHSLSFTSNQCFLNRSNAEESWGGITPPITCKSAIVDHGKRHFLGTIICLVAREERMRKMVTSATGLMFLLSSLLLLLLFCCCCCCSGQLVSVQYQASHPGFLAAGCSTVCINNQTCDNYCSVTDQTVSGGTCKLIIPFLPLFCLIFLRCV